MLELAVCLLQLNEVRFSAYRTALKLRAIQKKLCLDMVTINAASEAFDLHGLRAQNDKILDVADMVLVLRAIYGNIAALEPNLVDVPLCVDLALNWLLNVYDSQRTGQIRVLSFKVIYFVFLFSRLLFDLFFCLFNFLYPMGLNYKTR